MCRLEFWSSFQMNRSMRTRLLNCAFIRASCCSSSHLGPGGSAPHAGDRLRSRGSQARPSSDSGPQPPKPQSSWWRAHLVPPCPAPTPRVWEASAPRGLEGSPSAGLGSPPAAGANSPAGAREGAPGGDTCVLSEAAAGPGLTYALVPLVHGHRPAAHQIQDVQQGPRVSFFYHACEGRRVTRLPDTQLHTGPWGRCTPGTKPGPRPTGTGTGKGPGGAETDAGVRGAPGGDRSRRAGRTRGVGGGQATGWWGSQAKGGPAARGCCTGGGRQHRGRPDTLDWTWTTCAGQRRSGRELGTWGHT